MLELCTGGTLKDAVTSGKLSTGNKIEMVNPWTVVACTLGLVLHGWSHHVHVVQQTVSGLPRA